MAEKQTPSQTVGPYFAFGLTPEQYRYPYRSIAGPVIFALADTALLAVTLSVVGLGMALRTVTSDLSIHFLRRPGEADLIAEGTLIKPGSRLMVGDVLIYSACGDRPVAHAVGTYALSASGPRAR